MTLKLNKQQQATIAEIEAARTAAGMTVVEMANELAISERTLYRYLRTGKVPAPVMRLVKQLAAIYPSAPAPARRPARAAGAAAA